MSPQAWRGAILASTAMWVLLWLLIAWALKEAG
jgi:hypothetical protein